MPVDQRAAERFIWCAERLLDRHRYTLLFVDDSAEPVLEALRGYRNVDRGFRHGRRAREQTDGEPPASLRNWHQLVSGHREVSFKCAFRSPFRPERISQPR